MSVQQEKGNPRSMSKSTKIGKYSVGELVEYNTYSFHTGEKKTHIGTIVRGAKAPGDAIYQIRRTSNKVLDVEIWEVEINRRLSVSA